MIIDGNAIAEEIILALKKRPRTKKFLAAFLVGENPASEKFLAKKETTAKKLDVDFRVYRFPETITQDKLRKEVGKVALGARCGGVIVQLPLPARIDHQYITNVIPREKDIDVLGERALGAFYTGRNPVLPPSVAVVENICSVAGFDGTGRSAAVVGVGALVGKPVAVWLGGRVEELYLLDKGSNLSIVRDADLVVLGTGTPRLIKADMVKEGALVVDFGYGSIAGKVFGDFDSSFLATKDGQQKTISYTPTPGGTGPILVAKLFENFFTLVSLQK